MDEGWLEVSVSSLCCLSSSILAALTDRQAPKQNSLQAGVIHIPYLHGPRQHRQKQAGAQGRAGGGQMGMGGGQMGMGGGRQIRKEQQARANILNMVIN